MHDPGGGPGRCRHWPRMPNRCADVAAANHIEMNKAMNEMRGQGRRGARRHAAPTPDSRGYWLAAADGGVSNGGDAPFRGSAAAFGLTRPVVGIATNLFTDGYWLLASDGGIHTFDAPFFGAG